MRQLRQAIFEQLHEIEDTFNLHHSKGATIYFNPTNEFGEPVLLKKEGRIINKLYTDGPYESHAEEFNL